MALVSGDISVTQMGFASQLLFRWKTKVEDQIPAAMRSERGTTSIEYALVAGLIFLAIVFAASQLGTNVTRMYQFIADSLP